MTDHPALTRIRDIALRLPETQERVVEGEHAFHVADVPFARLRLDRKAPTLLVRADADWSAVPVADDTDWRLVEDRIARAWELSAPRGLLEAGGR